MSKVKIMNDHIYHNYKLIKPIELHFIVILMIKNEIYYKESYNKTINDFKSWWYNENKYLTWTSASENLTFYVMISFFLVV